MDITPQDNTATQPISDDQELAKALAGVLPDEPTPPVATEPELSSFEFEEAPNPAVTVPPISEPSTIQPSAPVLPTPSQPTTSDTGLEGIKSAALSELRPLIDRVDLPVEEKFSTYLLLIRSTDDASLIGPAHALAQSITDEKAKAEALLEIIKEIDYLTRKDQPVV